MVLRARSSQRIVRSLRKNTIARSYRSFFFAVLFLRSAFGRVARGSQNANRNAEGWLLKCHFKCKFRRVANVDDVSSDARGRGTSPGLRGLVCAEENFSQRRLLFFFFRPLRFSLWGIRADASSDRSQYDAS